MEFTRLSGQLVAAPQVQPADLRDIAAAGFVGIINNRPDGEAPEQPGSSALEAEARQMGLAWWHIPVAPGAMTEADVRAFAAALGEADGPVLAFCRTGSRSTALWNALQARA
jgi:uncharacterized protein (TIGR01244 family)